jgi:GR25 family glycosyltransferase involved in LPS biosynthesis
MLLFVLALAILASVPSKSPHVVIALPSLNEESTIEQVVADADAGCGTYYGDQMCLLLHCDSGSTDSTCQRFAEAPVTHCIKAQLACGRGKGAALRRALQHMVEVGAEYLICLDTDLSSDVRDWIGAFAGALREGGADFVAPGYARHRTDGTLTNLICYPVVRAFFHTDLRQPIGGEFGLSKYAAVAILNAPWPEGAIGYGVDILFTTRCLCARLRIAEVALPPKLHKPSAPQLVEMSAQVITTLLDACSTLAPQPRDVLRWSDGATPVVLAESLPDAATISDITTMLRASARQLHYEHGDTLRESTPAWLLETLNIGMDAETLSEAGWADILAWALRETAFRGGREYASWRDAATQALRIGWLLRAAAHLSRVLPMSNAEAECCVLEGVDELQRALDDPWRGLRARVRCISLQERHDRYALASDRLARAGAPAHFLRPSRDPRGGVYGCFDSHVRCLVDYAEERRAAGVNANAKTPRALFVLEDDAEFAEGYEAALKAVTHFIDTVPPDSYDLIFLTAKARVVMKSMGNGISMGAGVLGACGYLASPAFCERVAQLAPQAEGLHVDYWLNTVARKDHIFVLDQAITFQRNKDSDNTLAGVGTIKTGNPTATFGQRSHGFGNPASSSNRGPSLGRYYNKLIGKMARHLASREFQRQQHRVPKSQSQLEAEWEFCLARATCRLLPQTWRRALAKSFLSDWLSCMQSQGSDTITTV